MRTNEKRTNENRTDQGLGAQTEIEIPIGQNLCSTLQYLFVTHQVPTLV